jgi:hypothetical protein
MRAAPSCLKIALGDQARATIKARYEAQLAHVESNAVRKAYARAEYWAERVEMMAYWADRLDELRRGGIIVPLRA